MLFACVPDTGDEQVAQAELALNGICAHDQCTQGGPLDAACSPAAASICAVDPYCCEVAWDSLCVDEVHSVANNLVCTASQGSYPHTLCSTGAPLAPGCTVSPGTSCVASICAVDPYCCEVAWDSICVGEVASVCNKSCDDSGCDLDADGDPTPACGGTDTDDTCTPGELELTQCAIDLIGSLNSLIGTVNAIPVPFAQRTEADMTLGCPANTGVGEAAINAFSYVGALPRSCNRIYPDDCDDPARSSYWLSLVDVRRPAVYQADPYGVQMIWGGEEGDYSYHGACSPDPYGFDNAAAGIPKLLQPVNDVDGDGTIGYPSPRYQPNRVCLIQSHETRIRFYVPDGAGGRTYLERGNIAQISNPSLLPSSLSLPGVTSADRAVVNHSAYVAVDVTLKNPAGQVVVAFIEPDDWYVWFQWKQPATCGAP